MKSDRYPKISLVMPSFNQGTFLRDAINSVLAQDYPNLEFLIYDGGSSDESLSIIEEFSDKIDYWQSQKDGGQASALSAGFERANGDIFCWLNSDDILLPGALLKVGDIFRQSARVEFLYGNRRVMDVDGKFIGRHLWPYYISQYHWALGQPLAQEACFWSANLYEKVGGIDENLYFVMDYDLFYRMWKVAKFKKTMQFLGCIRIHEDSKNTKAQKVMLEERRIVIRKCAIKSPGYIMVRLLKRLDNIQSKVQRILIGNIRN